MTSARDIQKSIKYYHHIEFLVKLMGDKMDFNRTPTEEDMEHLKSIQNLMEDSEEPTEKDDTHQSIGQMKIDDGIEGFNT